MKLRNFLYLNTKVIEDYVSAIDGFIYDEEYCKCGDERVTGIIGGISERVMK